MMTKWCSSLVAHCERVMWAPSHWCPSPVRRDGVDDGGDGESARDDDDGSYCDR